MHVGITNPPWRGKRFRHCQWMRNPQFYVYGKRPIKCGTHSMFYVVILAITCVIFLFEMMSKWCCLSSMISSHGWWICCGTIRAIHHINCKVTNAIDAESSYYLSTQLASADKLVTYQLVFSNPQTRPFLLKQCLLLGCLDKGTDPHSKLSRRTQLSGQPLFFPVVM